MGLENSFGFLFKPSKSFELLKTPGFFAKIPKRLPWRPALSWKLEPMTVAKILLVEDDEMLGAQVVGHLREAGFEADWLQEGRQALKVDPEDYALWILDLRLPHTDGLDVLNIFGPYPTFRC